MKGTNPAGAQLDREAGDRRVWFRLVTPEIDRDGTITLPMGGRLEKYLRRPVFCWNHPLAAKDGSEPPPPPPEAVIGKVVAHEQTESALDILVEFAPKEMNEQAETCYQLVRGGYLGAVSYCGPILRQEDREIGGRTVPVITEWELWEASLVIVGSNPGAQVLERALRALTTRTSTPEPKPPAKRGARVEKTEMMSKLGLPEDCADRKVASKALDRYMDTTADNAEQRAMMRSSFEAHYAGVEEPDGDEPTKEEGETKAAEAEGEGDDVDKMDEETAKAALRMARRAAEVNKAIGGADAKVAAEVDALIADGQVERDPARRAEAISLHAAGRLLPALRGAGITSGTFTTSQRLRGGRIGTETEIATRGAANPDQKTAPADGPVEQARKAADEALQGLRTSAGKKK